ncbi:MAG: DUF5058 family protein [Spirochaetales bacterium]|nr:DUF5058 family protein [Spirochaetales bacterium]
MEFNVNHPILFILVGIVIFIVLIQSIFFLVKSWKRGKEIGMDASKLKKIARTAIIFTIAPAIAIVISVITLAKDLGVALPWMRLSVVGSLSYETIAATNAESAMGLTFGSGTALNASQYVTITLVMTISILVGIWLVPLICKRLQNGMIKQEKRDKKWSAIFSDSMFVGMISAFLGYVFCDVADIAKGSTKGLIPVCVLFVAAAVMGIIGLLVKKAKIRGLADYALPISLIFGMASGIPITAWLG